MPALDAAPDPVRDGDGARRGPAAGFFRATVQVTPLRLLVLLALAGSFAALDLRAGIAPNEEGSMLQWGRRIGGGEWLYRDVWCNEFPGQPLLQSLLGDSLVVWRAVRVTTGAIAAVLAYLLVRRETVDDRWALAAWAGVAAALAWPLTPGPMASALALAFGSLLAARERSALAGLLAGLAILFRPDVGAAAAIGAAILARGQMDRSRIADAADLRRATLTPLAIAVAVALLGLAPFLVVAPGDLLGQTLGLGAERWLPFPLAPHTTDPNVLLERLFPALLVAATVLWAVAALPARRGLALVPLVLAGLAYLLVRTDELHLVPLAAVLAVALAAAASHEDRRPLRIALATGIGIIVLHGVDRQLTKVRHAVDLAAVDLPGAGEVRTSPANGKALVALAAAVDRRAGPREPLLVAPPRYDRVRIGDALLYVLLDRRNPTRYDVAQPGVVTTAAVQREIREDLIRTRTRLIVRWLAPEARKTEANGSGRSSGVTLLDDWIATAFRRVGRYGDYELLERV